MIKTKKGFTLIEMTAVLAAIGSMTMVSAQEDQIEVSQDKARALGNEIFQYNSAVSRYLAANASDGASITGSHTGSNWLKGPGCSGGTAAKSYLDCATMSDNRTLQYRSTPRTTISQDADGSLKARTVWDTVRGNDGKPDTMAMGIASLVASGNYVSQVGDAAAGYQSPTLFCPETAGASANISAACDTERNAIVSFANTTASVEPWLRRDHGNTMEHVIEFDNGTGEPSSETDLAAVDGDNWRQMVNVSRIYNVGSSGNDSLVLGKMFGSSLNSEAFVGSYNLLENAVIADGDLGVMSDLYVKANALVSGNLEVDGDVSTSGTISALGNIASKSNITALGNIESDSDITALGNIESDSDITAESGTIKGKTIRSMGNVISGNDVIAAGVVSGRVFSDADNATRYVNPSSRSHINALTINDTDTNALVVEGRTRTKDLTVTNDMYLREKNNAGSYCNRNGKISRNNSGRILSCVNNAWKSAGGMTISLDNVYGRTSANTTNPSSLYIGVHSVCTMNGILHYAGSDDNIHVLDVRKGSAVGDKYRWYYRNGAESSGTKVRVVCYNI